MEVLNFIVCFITLRIIHVHSARSMGSYKWCIYQIVAMSLISQQLTILGPIFLMPLIGMCEPSKTNESLILPHHC
ncbi:hypothetical protein PFISCL1PPCAC_13587 [Pristionchus fissidentatus]|uniref:G protein-coupled receptor n=1 Tax=Pristionchus fissidentatus TaxID=1538716 RepID=A0AAV5VW42_9BILA|nr:hypothetical protein PFISCL1PPCAC_13587 [Pristionchus fissidentatus]